MLKPFVVAGIMPTTPDNPPQRISADPRSSDVTESGWAEAARTGDADAYGRLVMAYAVVARWVAYSFLRNWDEAEDVVQDASLSGWQAIERFDPARSFRPWFLRIVANAALDQLRRRRVRDAEPLHESLPSRGRLPDADAGRVVLREKIDAAMTGLPERQRVAVMMFDGEGYSHAEVASVLQVPEGTARSYVFHARRALRKALATLVEEPA